MRRFLSLLSLGLLWSAPAPALTPEAFRALIAAGDSDAAIFALAESVAETEGLGEMDHQRRLMTVLVETHPRNDAFTRDWLARAPDDPLAMTARAWHLAGLGWAQRGSARASDTLPEAFEAMNRLHGEAYGLFVAATKRAPDLLSASDGILSLSRTQSGKGAMVQELERIMAVHPNRGSLMRAMWGLAPSWGGSVPQVDLLCARYAGKVPGIQGYSPEICRIDAVFSSDFRQHPVRVEAMDLPAFHTHPILAKARLQAVIDGLGPAEDRLALLNEIAKTRSLTVEEGRAWDGATSELAADGSFSTAGEDRALRASLVNLQAAADNDPLNGDAVYAYLEVSGALMSDGTAPRVVADDKARLQTLLRASPHFAWAWWALAELEGSSWGDPRPLEAANAYFNNAFHLSGFRLGYLERWLELLGGQVHATAPLMEPGGAVRRDPAALAEMDRLLNCPLVAQTRLFLALCTHEGRSEADCRDGYFLMDEILARNDDTLARGACQREGTAALADLIRPMTGVDF